MSVYGPAPLELDREPVENSIVAAVDASDAYRRGLVDLWASPWRDEAPVSWATVWVRLAGVPCWIITPESSL